MGRPSAPFPLDGGRAGEGGDPSAAPTPTYGVSEPSAPEWAPKKAYAANAIPRARSLRKEMTLGERRLWAELRKLDLNFRKQAPIGRYIADFISHGAKLVVEIDGYYHQSEDAQARDAERDAWLKSQGYRVLRFTDKEAIGDPAPIIARIVAEASPPSPTLPPSRGKGEI